ncbi:MAG TPA: urea ABC transporter permease subunit UrtC [Dehalococcoidia bacterium]|nr:urea ABC transporter permease subunit UrtC [Dehalococcoidia bacterium]
MRLAVPGSKRSGDVVPVGGGSSMARAWLGQIAFVAVSGFVLLVIMPNMLSDFRLNLVGKLLAFAIVAEGLALVWGYGGMLVLGQGVFFGLGAYGMAMYMKLESSGSDLPDFMVWSGLDSLPWFWEPFRHAWFAIPVAIIGPGIAGFLLGYVVFRNRVKGVYFSIITQALALIVSTFFVGQQPYTGGTNGITNFTTLFGKHLVRPDTQELLYSATVVCLLATYLFAWWLTKSRFGRLLVALRDDEDRVRFTGYNVALVKAVVFGVSCAMAGLAGALFVPQVGIISPANLAIVPSIEMVIWVAVGGRASLAGAAVGAVAVGLAKSYLSEQFPEIWLYFLGGLFIVAVVLLPGGMAGTLHDAYDWLMARLPRRSAGEPQAAMPAAAGMVSTGE